MNAKIFLLFVLCVLLTSCRTVPAILSDERGADETRESLDSISDQQTELGITGSLIEDQSRGLAIDLAEFERAIKDGAGDNLEFEKIIQRIRERPVPTCFRDESERVEP